MGFDEEVEVVALDGEVDEAEVGLAGRGQGTADGGEGARGPEGRYLRARPHGDVQGEARLVLRARAVRSRPPPSRGDRSPRPFAGSPPGGGKREAELCRSRHLE